MAKHTTYTCDICGKDISEEIAFSPNKSICTRHPGFGIATGRYMKITVEEGDCGMWYTLDICTACRKKIVNYIECMKEKKGNEKMDDSISRKAAIEAIQNLYPGMPRFNVCNSLNRWYEKNKQYIECEDAINKLPSVQPEREKGKWIDRRDYCVCDQCGHTEQQFNGVEPIPRHTPFCATCGAEMETDDE